MHVHAATGHLTVVPVPTAPRREPRRLTASPSVDAAARSALFGAGGASLLGADARQHADQPGAGVRSPRSRGPTTSTRRSSSSRGCRACWPARWSAPTLAAAGVVLQALLRNPLATPFTLGVSAGAALGAMLAIAFGLDAGRARRRRRCRSPASPARWSATAIVYLLATRSSAGSRPTCCCSPASR